MSMRTETLTLEALSADRPGVLSAITQVMFRHGANINEISTMRAQPGRSATYLEVAGTSIASRCSRISNGSTTFN